MANHATRHARLLPALIAVGALALGAVLAAQPAAAQTASKLNCNGCVKSKQLKNNGIKSTDIKDGQVKNGDLGSNAVTGDKIAAGAVSNADLADDAVTTNKITDGAVTADKLAPGLLSGGSGATLKAFDINDVEVGPLFGGSQVLLETAGGRFFTLGVNRARLTGFAVFYTQDNCQGTAFITSPTNNQVQAALDFAGVGTDPATGTGLMAYLLTDPDSVQTTFANDPVRLH